MFSLLSGLNPKVYLVAILLFIVASAGIYINHLQSNNEKKDAELKSTSLKLQEANENNKKIIEAYEKTLAIEREKANQKAVTTEQKEVVITKYKTLTKTIEKRGEIKQDEKSNFTIVTF